MSERPLRSLRSRLIWRLVPLQAALLTALVVLVIGAMWATGYLIDNRDEDRVIDVVQAAIVRNASGGLTLRATADLAALRADDPGLWFVVRDGQDHVLTEGVVPPDFAGIGGALDQISQGRLGWQIGDDPDRYAARFKRVTTEAGPVQILTASQGPMPLRKAVLVGLLLFAAIGLPSLLLMTLATLIATPVVVRRALAGLGDAATQAGRVDFDRRGARLSPADMPAEVAPLIDAFNGALRRLDHGYERHKRFLTDAAHELRTPIAILQTRLEGLIDSGDKERLLEDVSRLATLAEQLLDLQRLDLHPELMAPVDLVGIGARVASDLAPLAIMAGYEMSFVCEAETVMVTGDQAALERAVINLVQNAIAHGGRKGSITISVEQPGTIAVCDQGPGIAPEHHERIFEPFHRLQSHNRGVGLGLNIVREIVQRHNGRIAVASGPGKGACFRMSFPVL
ncbi:HAMP domain-containing histidine kinase [Bradyrhizobium sp. U87765 SZCCT0131]|uniref:sensor histidine kinase n=1 Tax=unclassified Bradyrhizobium TaxID=2631580 RepID=UPI001BAC8586|nr:MULTISPECIES: HAMP domain-containing sensor histidine kinase [unclassified Bradyrhizobium]MBR1222599.1 HAMP domain-containing histidine kinase [Bradyrhizobium sp. U87765 SZCCT0131]MBR1265320.1 HAMP domain-containing histidine kinase [Bradyrhizobium sp. U87765 SZCCT0134]MBR1302901.1 HAMP domain-containing histidine kinase [Bradyrhizobium sp. U87765 SZCCT0110]MBR1323599.1 HAMP domain-containing histidine kinase [Bradyrhizobium sp. U87765 SZCCT0109]MBR1346830.1 HAMP domain-containing histidine